MAHTGFVKDLTHAEYVANLAVENGLAPAVEIAAMTSLSNWSSGTLRGFLDGLAYEGRTICTPGERAAIEAQAVRVRDALDGSWL